MTTIKLSWYEMEIAALAGVQRHVQNLARKRNHAYGAGDHNAWQLNIEGCLGEMALAKFLGKYWSGKGVFRGGDVGDYQVRTRSKDYYELIIHPNDPDGAVFWLVCGINGTYTIKGWIIGRDGKKKEYWKDPAGNRPAYFVPQHVLNSPLSGPG